MRKYIGTYRIQLLMVKIPIHIILKNLFFLLKKVLRTHTPDNIFYNFVVQTEYFYRYVGTYNLRVFYTYIFI